jgi:hypothetical protein
MDILLILQMIYEYGERLWNDTDRGKQKNLEKIMYQCRFIHHKYHMDSPGCEPGTPQ